MLCQHPDPTCLCDVKVEVPCTIMNIDFGRDSFYAKEIMAYLGLSSPMSTTDMLLFFETQAMLKDKLAKGDRVQLPQRFLPNGHVNPRVATAKVTTEVREFIAMMTINGAPNAVIKSEVKRVFDLDLTMQYTAMLRKRCVKADNL